MSPIEAAPAKINLALHLRRRRDDGYHDLETLFAFTAFGDTLAYAPGDGLSLAMTGPWAAAVDDTAGGTDGSDNLVLRAARALAAAAGVVATGALTLDKRIPVAAGLGGGSADAAAALRLLNRAWAIDWPVERLAPLAAALGADVPACLDGRTSFGSGRGEALVPLDLGVAGTAIVLVNPRVAVATGPVFGAWDRVDRGGLDPAAWRSARNDLAPGAIALAPVIAEVLAALAATAPDLARMSGSGATCFALYPDRAAAATAEERLRRDRPEWWSLATVLL